jgi:hypothetical protein
MPREPRRAVAGAGPVFGLDSGRERTNIRREADVLRRASAFGALVCILASLRCSARPKISDTGYTGTWSKGNDRVISIVAIAKVGERYLFRWTKRSYDGKLEIRCGWDGRCEERLNGRSMATYEFRTQVDPASGRLVVECDERRLEPEKLSLDYRDELVVEPGGKVLSSYTVERSGTVLSGDERPRRSFDKVADAVSGPLPTEVP